MAPKTLASLCVLALGAVLVASESSVVFSNTIDIFKFSSDASRQSALDSGRFIPSNCVPAGVKGWNGSVYVSVPRWAPGVPATLTQVSNNLLSPFPNTTVQNASGSGFRYVQSMEIDSKGRMWVLDVGRQNILKGEAIDGTPSLWIFDLTAKTKKGEPKVKQLLRYDFPEEVASSKTSFINDIVVDDTLDVAYISEASGEGAIIVFDLNKKTSHRVTHSSMQASKGFSYQLDGVDMGKFSIPIDGIALTPDKSTVYYNALLGNHLYSVPAVQLRSFTPGAELDVTDEGEKPASDGLAFGSNGKLYFGSLADNSVYEWTPGTPPSSARVIASDLSWPDTFGFDGKGNLLVLTNQLHKWISGSLQPAAGNFRVVAIPIGDNVRSYVYGPDAVLAEAAPQETAAQATVETVTVPTSTVATSAEATTAAPTSTETPATSTPSSESESKSEKQGESQSQSGSEAEEEGPLAWLENKFDSLVLKIQSKLPGKGTLPQLSWCTIACAWNKTKQYLYEARDSLHTCAANTTACRENVSHVYQTDALRSGAALCTFFALLCWVGSLVTGDLSWVDRLWSILPVIYTLHFWSYDTSDPRLSVMSTLALAWGIRLTYNFYRKGGYTSEGEDYRWAVLRKEIPNPWVFHVFNLVFVAIIQNILLFAIALPAYTALQSDAPLKFGDIVASLSFFLALALETAADQQQWIFQESKHGKLPRLPELAADYERGFLTSGLFIYSRHPNFFAEQMLWISFAVFSVTASGSLDLFSWAGAVSLVMLFQGSTTFTEKITASKYPRYAEYQQTTSRLWPIPPVHHPHSD